MSAPVEAGGLVPVGTTELDIDLPDTQGDLAGWQNHITLMPVLRSQLLTQVAPLGGLALTGYPRPGGGIRYRLNAEAARQLLCSANVRRISYVYEPDPLTGYYEDTNGRRRYQAEVRVTYRLPHDRSTVEVRGFATSEEGLHKTRPLTATIASHVRQHALAAADVHACADILGIGALTPEQVTSAGLDPSAFPVVEYRKGGSEGSDAPPPRQQKAPDVAPPPSQSDSAEDDLRCEIEDTIRLLDVLPSAVGQVVAILSEFTSSEGKTLSRDRLDKLSGKWLLATHKKALALQKACHDAGESGLQAALEHAARIRDGGRSS